jgi:hypothetical protein
MIDLTKLTDSVAVILESKEPPTEQALRDIVKAQAGVLALTSGATVDEVPSEDDVERVVKTLQTRFSIHMELGTLFESENYKPWLANRQGDIDPYYWQRYRKHLLKKGYPPHVVGTLDLLTDKILDHLEDPTKEGSWAMKGLVVGHVQSGKTANYTGLLCKAADAGYKVIIVLAGTLNALRNQTQERIDADFIGWCTREKKPVGSHAFGTERRPVCFTTSLKDFKKAFAESIAMDLAAVKEPVVLIIKKNKSTLKNLHDWLSDNNRHNLKNFPMLLIDDEADYASINTKKEDQKPAAINMAIRNLLSLFARTSFVGYTATPFANIFIDPESEDEMQNGESYRDLFPRDFILSLDPPDNYVGPERLFADEPDLDCVRKITDNETLLPLRHNIAFVPRELPESLRSAIRCLIIAKAIRLLRGQLGQCHSMMVNASRFTGVQTMLSGLVLDYLKQLKQSISNYGALDPVAALQDHDLALLKQDFDREFSLAGFSWDQVQKSLKDAAAPIEVVVINSGSQDRLDYGSKNYPDGRSIIAVGGLGLSRGLTLEGLLVSYFLRNTVMYDTLMQMGRWFGYRDGYADLCRIYMTPSAASWYAHISEATDELRRDFKAMERAKLTPKDFGLRVRSHPTALIVTARNKMRTGRVVPIQIALEGRLASTSIVFGDAASVKENSGVLETVCLACDEVSSATRDPLGWLWKSVPAAIVKSAVRRFSNHPECLLTYPDPLITYIELLEAQANGTLGIDVLLRSVENKTAYHAVGSRLVAPIERTVEMLSDEKIIFNKRRVGSKGDERAGLTDTQIELVKKTYDGANIPDKKYRQVSGRNPLLLLYFAKVTKDKSETERVVPAYGLSFPGDSTGGTRPRNLVEYVVNTTWWEQNYGVNDDEPEEEADEA